MKDGTYLMDADGKLKPLKVNTGYWVAEEEVKLEDVKVGEIVGIWTDANGKQWIDKSHLVSELSDAVTLADAWEQIAIYDNKKGEALEV